MKVKMARGFLIFAAVAMSLLFWGAFAQAAVPFWQAPQASTHTAYGTGYLSGVLKIYPSTSTAAASPSLTLNGLTGDILATSSVTANFVQGGGADFTLPVTGISLSEIEDLTANKTFTMANKTLEWQFTNPTGGMLWEFTGAAAGHSLEIAQTGGNPSTDMHLLHLHAEDADPTILHLVPGGAASRAILVHANGDTVTNPGRFEMTAEGAMAWGTGGGATDATLARTGIGALQTNSTLTAAGFSGPLTGLASLNLPLTGGTLTGPLTLAGSSLTVTGSSVSITGGEFVVGAGDNRFIVSPLGVGIGQNSPSASYLLNVGDAGAKTYYARIGDHFFTHYGINGGQGGNFTFGEASAGTAANFTGASNKTASPAMTFVSSTAISTANDFEFRDGSTPLMTISKLGSVGISTNTPTADLDINPSNNLTAIHMHSYSDTGGHAPAIRLRRAKGTKASPTAASSAGDDVGAVHFQRRNAGGAYESAASIWSELGGAAGTNDSPGILHLATTPDGALYPVERLSILPNGYIGAGTTLPVEKLHVQDGVVLSSTTSGFGAFTGYGSSGGCLMFRDTDNAGWTECKFLDGVMSCATDADGVCD